MSEKVQIREEIVTIPTYKLGEPEKAPLFIEKRAYQGSTGKVYPLPVTEKMIDQKEDKQYKAIILENEYLYVMILPELGGRIQRALDKTNGYDFVYYNQVVKPALVGLAGPWISGGIEFNWPQHHRPSTFSPVDYMLRENEDGSATAVVGETDIMYGTKGNAEITLYPGKAYIEIKGRLYNRTDVPQTFLWWANPAVTVNDYTFSVFPPDVNAVMDHGKRAVSTFPIATGEYYKVDYSKGVDISRYKNIPVPTSYMAAHSDFDFIGNYDESKQAGLLHVADHHFSPGKKQWTWGNGDFGKMWDKNLTDEDGPYIELMTGVFTDNQPDFTWLKPNEEKTFTQYFMPYKGVGRVGNATKECAVSVTEDTLNVYATSDYSEVTINVTLPEGQKKTIKSDLRGCECLKFRVDGLSADRHYRVDVVCACGKTLVSLEKFEPQDIPVPNPAKPLKKPAEIESLEELLLAGQHLEQYRHATRLPEDYYLEGLKRDKTDIRLNNAYGLLLLRRGETGKSVQYFEEAIKKQTWRNPNPYSGECFYNLGLAFLRLSEKYTVAQPEREEYLHKAFDSFFKATWSMETQGNAFFHMGRIMSIEKEWEKALEYTEEALVRNAHNMNARVLKCWILAKLGRPYARFLQESREIDGLCLGLILFEKYQAAVKEGSAQSISEVIAEASFGRDFNVCKLGRELIENGLFEEAEAVLSQSTSGSPLVMYYAGYAAWVAGLEDKAKADFAKGDRAKIDYCFPNETYDEEILNAVLTNGASRNAAFLLGNLLYDKKRYSEAAESWKLSVEGESDALTAEADRTRHAIALRNLSIYYYNKEDDVERAKDCIARAVKTDPHDTRYTYEQDQLLEKLSERPEIRFEKITEKLSLEEIESRDTLTLCYVKVLNLCGRYEEALEVLKRHRFHVWEGGEGKVAGEYKTALLSLAGKALSENEPEKALEYAKKTFSFPDNLGEGKLFNVADNHAYYIMALAMKAQGQTEAALKYFERAAEGSLKPEIVRYYNDQPSDYIYYIGLALNELSQTQKAAEAFETLVKFGEEHLKDTVEYDFFAVSLPELTVYKDDIQKRNDDYCKMLIELGKKGLSKQ